MLITSQWIEVLVDCVGTQALYTYQAPPEMDITPGDILAVPFGRQQVGAIALRFTAAPPAHLSAAAVRPVVSVVSRGVFSATYWQLLGRVAAYYQVPLMQVARAALPPGLLRRSQRRIRLCAEGQSAHATEKIPPAAVCVVQQLQQSSNRDYSWQHLQKCCPGAASGIQWLLQRRRVESYLALPQSPRPKCRQAVTVVSQPQSTAELSNRQQEVLSLLQRRGGDLWLQEALQYCRTTSATLKTLAERGYVVIEAREVLRHPDAPTLPADQPKTLNADQQAALDKIEALTSYSVSLLHGVTGSGKTEVYLQAIAPRLAAGHSALVLVPEIGLTPQLTDRFRQRFGENVCVYHSGLSDGERYDAWRRMLQGNALVVIGTRSAVFAPLPCLGLIVLDEEHDSSFKQDQPAPCYHARTVAQWRAQLEGCPLVLGSATPSLESWTLVKEQAPQSVLASDDKSGDGSDDALRQYLPLPQRVHARPLPPITVVDMRQELAVGNRSLFSRTLSTALGALQDKGEQGILFIQRRGHSRFVSCRSCGHVMMCPDCDVSLSHHQPNPDMPPYLRCHYCGFGQPQPAVCPACASPYLKHFGSGTQRVEQALRREFPQLRCLRFDSDTTRHKGAHRALLTRFAQGEADVLVGTQMLTKGIDLPQVTLVGIMAADGLLYMGDFRASERAFQILTQVAGRAGRGQQPGRVVLQTYTPDHPVVAAVKRQDIAAFLTAEKEQRAALGYPPWGRLVLLRITSPDGAAAEQASEKIAEHLEPMLSADWSLLGPAPALVLRVARRYRWQILLKGAIAAPLPDLSSLSKYCPARVSLTVDIDPLNL